MKKYKYVMKWVITDGSAFKIALFFSCIGFPMTILFILMLGEVVKIDTTLTLITTGIIGVFNLMNGLIRLERCTEYKKCRVELSEAEKLLGEQL